MKPKGQNGVSDAHISELKEWVRHMINEAEKNGDLYKRNKFLSLKAELL